MSLSNIVRDYSDSFKTEYGGSINADQWSALNAILGCRTGQYGSISLYCDHCDTAVIKHLSCGHRSCPQCQHHATVQWLERQMEKLLPVTYYMVTFTLPYQLRTIAKNYPTQVYTLMFATARKTLRKFGLNDKKLSGEMAMTAVLHTHSRRLDYHPHIHCVVPNGAFDKKRRLWRTKKGKVLFINQNLAKVFRATLLKALNKAGFNLPKTPQKWVVDCKKVGSGTPALKYLSRYLYRGVISDKQIVNDDGQNVTFSYKDSDTGKTMQRTLRGEQFLLLLLQHALPKGFRRVRDYGFLHTNAKKTLHLLQHILKVFLPLLIPSVRPSFICPNCNSGMKLTGFLRPKIKTVPG